MLVTTTPTIEGGRITRYYGIVSGETIIGANVFRDFFASIRDVVGGRSGSYEEVLREAKDIALREMQEHARALGANAVIGVDLDYETVGGSGSMLMVTACGTGRAEKLFLCVSMLGRIIADDYFSLFLLQFGYSQIIERLHYFF